MKTLTLTLAGFLLAMPPILSVAQEKAPPPASPVPEVHGINPANLDKSVKPCEDFYEFATGGWAAHNPIPPAFPRWGSFDVLAERNQEDLRTILEAAAKNEAAPAGSIERKLGDFYAAAMNVEAVDAAGAKPLAPEMERIAAIKNFTELGAVAAQLQRLGVNAFFGFGSEQDAKDATKVIAGLDQGGLSLPDRDYYLKEDERSKGIREAYVKHVAKDFELLGDSPEASAAEAQTLLKLETEMARASLSRIELRDPKATYHPMAQEELRKLAPDFPWDSYFGAVGMPAPASLNVGMPEFFRSLSAQLKAVPLLDWKTYLRWHLLRAYSPYLSAPFVSENFTYSQIFTGSKEDLPRWRKAVAGTNRALGFALGQLYVKDYFSPESKAKVLDILHNIRAALKEDLQTLPWMSEATRAQALVKLSKIEEKIGYPDKWRDYSSLKIDRSSYAGNVMRANEFEFQRDLNKIGKPLDRTEWGMTPATVNAYYSPQKNEIVFPAGILQPPFFDPKADDAVNYGGIGVVIGHEITHGFDDKGSQYDGEGNLKNWWTPEDLKAFQSRGENIASQASEFVVEGDLHQQGKLVEGEAIADLGGVSLAYRAYQKSLGGKPAPVIGDFTGDQRFFLSFATVWAQNIRPQYARMLATVDPHPAARYRVNGTLSTVPAFAKAFGCEAGPMIHADTSEHQIW